MNSITCAACGSTNTEPCCHPAEFCQAICNDCNTPLNADGSVWVEKQEPTLEQFQRWLEDRAHEANAAFDGEPLNGDDMATHQWRCALMVNSCRTATSLLMHFKLEQGA